MKYRNVIPSASAWLFVSILICSTSAWSKIATTIAEIELDPGFERRLITVDANLIVLATPKVNNSPRNAQYTARSISQYSFRSEPAENGTDPLGWMKVYEHPLNKNLQFFHVRQYQDRQALVTYGDQQLFEWQDDTQTFKPTIKMPSIYRSHIDEPFPELAILEDINGDGHDDVLMPDFSGWQISLTSRNGELEQPSLLGIPGVTGIGTERYSYYRAQQPYTLDLNLDTKPDLAFWDNNRLEVHLAQIDNQFSQQTISMDTQVDIFDDGLYTLSIGDDAEDTNEPVKLLFALDDLNGDEIDDMIIYAVQGEGLFGKETQYEIHLGAQAGTSNALAFELKPSSIVSSDGIQVDMQQVDFDGDGAQEIMVTSLDLGIGTIIRALLSRTISLDLAIYKMTDGVYPSKPNITRSITATIDLSDGDLFIPAIVPADVDGDGHKDLLVQEGLNKLRIFSGVQTNKLFSTRPQVVNLVLPDQQSDLQVADLNEDGVDELVVMLSTDVHDGKRKPRINVVTFTTLP